MKTLFYSILTLCSLNTAFGQIKTSHFKEEITYKSADLSPEKQLVLKAYVTNDNQEHMMYLDSSFGNIFSFSTLVSDGKFFEVKHNFVDNTYVPNFYSLFNLFGTSTESLFEEIFGKKNTLVKTTRTNKIINQDCVYYEANVDDAGNNLSLCINTNSAIDNVSALIPNSGVKGLILEVSEPNKDEHLLRATETKTIDIPFKFDLKDAIAKKETFLAELEERNSWSYATDSAMVDSTASIFGSDNRYEDPINNFYMYQTSENENVNQLFSTIASLNYSLVFADNDYDGNPDIERSTALKTAEGSTTQLVKQFKKNKLANKSEVKELNNLFKTYFDDAKKFKLTKVSTAYDEAASAVDSAYDVADIDLADYYDPYTSTYKTTDISVIDLAIDNPDVENFLKVAPEHCKNLKATIPTFTDKELGNLVYNYTGQVCDLYIYQSGSVGLTETINAMRKSILEITNKYDKLKKEDKEKLTTFLNALD